MCVCVCVCVCVLSSWLKPRWWSSGLDSTHFCVWTWVRFLGQGTRCHRPQLKWSCVPQRSHVISIHLPMQGTWVPSLIQEDPTHHWAAKPMRHNYWACVLQLLKLTGLDRACAPERPLRWEAWRVAPTRCNSRRTAGSNKDPVHPRINFKKKDPMCCK